MNIWCLRVFKISNMVKFKINNFYLIFSILINIWNKNINNFTFNFIYTITGGILSWFYNSSFT